VEKKSNLQAQKELFTAVLGHTNGYYFSFFKKKIILTLFYFKRVSPDVIEVQKHFEIKIE
jgi:hypothetical protein